MAYDPGAIDATLAAAIGDDPGLIAELRGAFLESVTSGVAAVEAARDDVAWIAAAARLKGLAASFGALRLMSLAGEAERGHAGDAAMVRRLRRAVERL